MQNFNSFYYHPQESYFFHGTGRFSLHYENRDKSKVENKQVDVLKSILELGILPAEDHLAKLLLKETQTISLAKSRLYARVYAQMFGDNPNSNILSYEFGTNKFWKKHFMRDTVKALFTYKNFDLLPIIYQNLKNRFSFEEFLNSFNIFHHKEKWRSNQCILEDNYPIIFAIKQKDISEIKLPYGLDLYEVRTSKVIKPEQVAYIEVPINLLIKLKHF